MSTRLPLPALWGSLTAASASALCFGLWEGHQHALLAVGLTREWLLVVADTAIRSGVYVTSGVLCAHALTVLLPRQVWSLRWCALGFVALLLAFYWSGIDPPTWRLRYWRWRLGEPPWLWIAAGVLLRLWWPTSARRGFPKRLQGAIVAFAGLLALSLCASLARARVPASAPNLVLVSLDAVGASHLPMHGYDRDTMPAVRACADRGAAFVVSYSESNWTLPSHASLLSGLFASRHGAHWEHHGLPRRVTTLAERFRESGYATAGFVDGHWVSRVRGFAQGFDHFDDRGGRSARVVPRAMSWIARKRARPFFLFLHLYDAHLGYEPEERFLRRFADPEYQGRIRNGTFEEIREIGCELSPRDGENCRLTEAERRHLRDRYDAELLQMDERLGRLFDRLARSGPAWIIITADHGTELFEHGGLNHNQLYEESVRVPFVLCKTQGSAFPQAEKSSLMTRSVDVAPTFLDLAGISIPPSLDGRSLLPALDGRALPRLPVVIRGQYLTAVRVEDAKLICPRTDVHVPDRHPLSTRRCELYSLIRDPREQDDLSRRHSRLVKELKPLLASRIGTAATRHVEVDPATRDRLRALGYLQEP